MTSLRIRLNSYQFFWVSSIFTAFYFGYADKKCSKTIQTLIEESNPYQYRGTNPISLFATTFDRQNEILERLFNSTTEFSFGSDGFRVISHYFYRKGNDWYRSPKESPRLDEAGCGKEMMRQSIYTGIAGSVNLDNSKEAFGGEFYLMPIYRQFARTFEGIRNQDIGGSVTIPVGSSGRKISRTTLQKHLETHFKEEGEKVFHMTPNAQIGVIFQNPRQWALEVVNDRYSLPTSDHYMAAIGEFVVLMENLIPQCSELAKIFKGGCTLLRLEDILTRPGEVFNIPSLAAVDYEPQNRFEIPIVENEVDAVLKPIKKQLSSLGYAGWETKNRLHSLHLI